MTIGELKIKIRHLERLAEKYVKKRANEKAATAKAKKATK